MIAAWLLASLSGVGAPAIEAVSEGTVRFEKFSAQISPEDRARLLEIGQRLAVDERDILLIGHSDRTGQGPQNRALSRDRADAVGRILRAAGVPKPRIEQMGAGYSDPIDPGETPEADAANRRVEIWLVGRDQVGWISWRYRRLQARTPRTRWSEAHVKQPLQIAHRVRTVGVSAGEITFRRGHILYLGPNGSLTVFEPRARIARSKREVGDVHLEGGALLARRSSAGSANLDVTTEDGVKVESSSRQVRVEYRDRRGTSLVSVYEGRVKVEARGEAVVVQRGYGTRVRRKQPPEPPTKLPPAPDWRGTGPIVAVGPVDFLWRAPRQGGALVELTSWKDAGFTRALTSTVVAAPQARHRFEGVDPGSYRGRISGVDEKGLVGFPGSTRPVYVLEPSAGVTIEGGRIVLDGPGTFVAPTLDGFRTAVRRSKTDPWSPAVRFARPGPRRVDLLVEQDGQLVTLRTLEVEVARPTVTVFEAEEELRLIATDRSGRPARWVKLAARILAPAEEPCGPLEYPELALVRCSSTDLSGVTPLEPMGAGQFRLPRPSKRGYVLVKETETGLATAFFAEANPDMGEVNEKVTKANPETDSDAPRRNLSVVFGGAGGVEFRELDRVIPFGAVELGLELKLTQSFDLRLHVDVAFTRFSLERGERDPQVTAIPVVLGVDLVWAAGPWRPWAGAGAGVRFVGAGSRTDVSSTEPVGQLSLGLGRALGERIEAFLAVRAELGPLLEDRAEWAGYPTALAGFRTRN